MPWFCDRPGAVFIEAYFTPDELDVDAREPAPCL
jgi:hypothetical protein